MKKWTILILFMMLYAWAMFLFFRNFKGLSGRKEPAATSSPPASISKLMPPRLNAPLKEESLVAIQQLGDGTFKGTLPYRAVTELLLAYVGLHKATPQTGALVEISTKERYVPAADARQFLAKSQPEIKGSIQLRPPGEEPSTIKFDSRSVPSDDSTNPVTMESVFNNTFPPKMAEIAGRYAGPTALIPVLGNTDPVIRNAAEQALLAIAGSSSIDIKLAESLADLMESKDPLLRDIAVRVLGAMTDPRIVPLLVAILSDESPEVRASALEALGKVKDLRAMNPVMSSAADSSAAVRLQAVRTLGHMGSTQAVEVLIDVLSDEDPNVRQASVEALEKIRDPGLCDRLLAVANGGDPALQKVYVKALGDTQAAQALGYLSEALKSPQPDIRDAAAEALGKLRNPAAVNALAAALQDEDVFVRSGAVSALEKIPDRRVIQPLIGALQDKGLVQLSVAMALNRLTGQNFGTNQASWQVWWEQARTLPLPSLPCDREQPALMEVAPPKADEPEEAYDGSIAWPSVRLAGVLRGSARRRGAAVINSRIIREGDVLAGIVLQEVLEDSVKLRYRHQTRILRVNEAFGE
ncbi:MAG TPA: hypothetical protein DCZ95_13455 [Verrucomicrobia bacterium]|nr:MAG: hypothetical protein A2X46_11310 [Lentisphaerae bacterium GWF2_57_35]HBA85090.1 hypothetical protein [Verrucomicrobiota bacterium]